MSDVLDRLSYTSKVATDILFVKNPVGTSMGVLTGIILDGLLSIATPFSPIATSIQQSGVKVLHFIALGIFGFNIRSFVKKDDVNLETYKLLEFIEDQARRGRISRAQAKIKYNEIIQKAVDSVRMDSAIAEKMRGITE